MPTRSCIARRCVGSSLASRVRHPTPVAVAGAVLVRNSRVNYLARMQEWDYYLGIAAVKRMQGLYQSTLVAQGAFSLYRTDEVRRIGGWPDAIGEDIVVTWRLMETGDGVLTEPTAVAFTDVPVQLRHFMRQRARWARGMVEGIRAVPPWRQRRVLARVIAGIDLLIPLLDIGYALIFLPGLVLWAFGYPIIVSLWTLLVLPVTLVVYGALRRYQQRRRVRSAPTSRETQPARLHRVPPVLPGPVLHRLAHRLRAGARRHPPALEVAAPVRYRRS